MRPIAAILVLLLMLIVPEVLSCEEPQAKQETSKPEISIEVKPHGELAESAISTYFVHRWYAPSYQPHVLPLEGGKLLIISKKGHIQEYDIEAKKAKVVSQISSKDVFVNTATLLDSGKVLITGRSSLKDTPETNYFSKVFDPRQGKLFDTKPMNTQRNGYVATALPGGKVLISGGYYWKDGEKHSLGSLEVFDTKILRYTNLPESITPRADHTQAILNSDEVAFLGGFSYPQRDTVKSIDIFNFTSQEITHRHELPKEIFIHNISTDTLNSIFDGMIILSNKNGEAVWFDVKDNTVKLINEELCGFSSDLTPEYIVNKLSKEYVLITGYRPDFFTALVCPNAHVFQKDTGLFTPAKIYHHPVLSKTITAINGEVFLLGRDKVFEVFINEESDDGNS